MQWNGHGRGHLTLDSLLHDSPLTSTRPVSAGTNCLAAFITAVVRNTASRLASLTVVPKAILVRSTSARPLPVGDSAFAIKTHDAFWPQRYEEGGTHAEPASSLKVTLDARAMNQPI